MKLLRIILVCFILNISCFISPSKVVAQNFSYARITEEHTYLYRTATFSSDISNIYFELEKTYFVKILDIVNDFYKVKYQNVVGYVVASQVLIINGTPICPYPENITFQINSSLNTKLRTTPQMSDDNNIIGVLPSNYTTLTYIGKTIGEESVKSLGADWYYCCYNYENSGCILGYVYAPLTENLTPILANTESFGDKSETSENITAEMPTETQNLFLVVIMCLPAVIIFIVLVTPFNKQPKTINSTPAKKKGSKRNSKKDFYEID